MGKGEENGRSEARETSFLSKKSTEASKMLEAALLQMDGIISGACAEGSDNNSEWKDSVKEATKNLISAIQNAPSSLQPPDPETVDVLLHWLQPVSMNQAEKPDCNDSALRRDKKKAKKEIVSVKQTKITTETAKI